VGLLKWYGWLQKERWREIHMAAEDYLFIALLIIGAMYIVHHFVGHSWKH
jgi:hypothetical protein